jgi:hypothetical protein
MSIFLIYRNRNDISVNSNRDIELIISQLKQENRLNSQNMSLLSQKIILLESEIAKYKHEEQEDGKVIIDYRFQERNIQMKNEESIPLTNFAFEEDDII